MEEKITLTLLSDETRVNGDYDERIRKYSCPCGKGEVIWSKERPNGSGYGYQAIFFYNYLRGKERYRIKGITVEIGGDTTRLDKAIKGVNNNNRNTQSALKDVNNY